MAEFAKETAIGGYKPVEGGSSDSECTHVILTLDEYDGLKQGDLQRTAGGKNAEYNAEKKSTRYRAKRRAE